MKIIYFFIVHFEKWLAPFFKKKRGIGYILNLSVFSMCFIDIGGRVFFLFIYCCDEDVGFCYENMDVLR